MKELELMYQNTNTLLHAYGIEGEHEKVLAELLPFFEKEVRISTQGNPDFHIQTHETFGINEGKALQNLAVKKAFSGERKIFVILFESITREAQNALLKLFEDPCENVHFFIVTPQTETLLPTLTSRLMLVNSKRVSKENTFAETFLKASCAKRLELLKDIIDQKDKASALQLLNELEAYLYTANDIKKEGHNYTQAFTIIRDVRGYLRDRSASVKMLLEHVALMVPKT